METEPILLPKEPEKIASVAPAKTSWGALFGVVIIVILLVIAGFYFWGAQLAQV